ncbi:MAG TPA: hypothetical protein VM639_01610 [Dongiaceae bacterium]|nr:hypothetical protein [Dongiaceae bacterium]
MSRGHLVCDLLRPGKIGGLTGQLRGLIVNDLLHARRRACPSFRIGLRDLTFVPRRCKRCFRSIQSGRRDPESGAKPGRNHRANRPRQYFA